MITRIRTASLITLLGVALGTLFHAPAVKARSAHVWDRQAAIASARAVDPTAEVYALHSLTLAGDTTGLLEGLQSISQRPSWPEPARDFALLLYVQQLRELPAKQVPQVVMNWLRSYEHAAFVPHEEHPSTFVPLFNVRAAAAGVENGWRRQEARLEGQALLAANPASIADAFLLEPDLATRRGYLEAVEQADVDRVRSVKTSAATRVASAPDLTELAGIAALIDGDADTLGDVLEAGEGPGVQRLLRESARQLPPSDNAELLDRLLDTNQDTLAALAIAELAPVAMSETGTRQRLIGTLSHPALGAPAALALARDGSRQSREALRSLADSGDEPAATRARMALSLARERQKVDGTR